MSIEKAGGVSYAYVDADGAPLDMSYWVRVNIGMTGVPSGIAILGYVNAQDRESIGAGVWLGAALALVALTLSRVWTLIHDKRHRGASREWWVAHQATVRGRALLGASFGFLVLAGWLAMAIAAHADFVAALLVGPIFGVLTVLALLGDSLLKRRAAAPVTMPPRRM